MSFFNNTLKIINDRLIGKNSDIEKKKLTINNKRCYLYFCKTIVDIKIIYVIDKYFNEFTNCYLDESMILLNHTAEKEIHKLIDNILSGNSVLLSPDFDFAIIFDSALFPIRSISEPAIEKSVRGSKDSFNENIINNIALIRKRIKSDNLIIESFVIGKISKTNVSLIYIKDIVDNSILLELRDKLNNINVNSLIMTDKALEELLVKQRYNPFPLVRYTERPDVACISLLNKKFVILVDNSCSALITPSNLFDHTKHIEEFRLNPILGTFSRLVRFICLILSFFLIPTWFCLLSSTPFNNGLQKYMTINLSSFLLAQVLIVEFLFDVIRMSAIHIPNVLVSTIGLISAIILSEVSIRQGFLYEEVLLLCAIEGLCGFVTPSFELSLTNKFIKYIFIIIVFLFGKYGYIIFISCLFLLLANIKVFNKSYLHPLYPFDLKETFYIIKRPQAKGRDNL